MPRPNPPPTPGSSSDIHGKDGQSTAPSINLPPTAFHYRSGTSSSVSSHNGSDSSYHPVSPHTAPEQPRKKLGVITKDDFTLPPPPTRSRKIIQMKPRDSEHAISVTTPSNATTSQSAGKTTASSTGGRKRSNNGTTAAGRKIARKTAHSLIERRRRSKMNEEFDTLKNMIPATKGQEMHKLAILQAGIEYLRYLEQCVQDLQTQNNSPRPPPPSTIPRNAQEELDDSDEEMAEEPADTSNKNEDAATPSTAPIDRSNSLISLPPLSQITTSSTTSPAVFSSGAGARNYSISSASQASYSPYIHSNQASPAFGPQLHHVPHYGSSLGFGLGSPALKPLDSAHNLRYIAENAIELPEKRSNRTERELDQEATAALLMLNHDRRQWRPAKPPDEDRRGSGGMSVRDLLSG